MKTHREPELYVEDYSDTYDSIFIKTALEHAAKENRPIYVDGTWYWVYKKKMNEGSMYKLGYKHGKEEMQESLRDLIGIE